MTTAARIGIRAETMHRYERRAPLAPDVVGKLTNRYGLQFIVQRSPQRFFHADAYRDAGAEIVTELGTRAPIVMSVKQIPADFVFDRMVGILFAHVAKGQPENMELLSAFLNRGATLLDYEYIENANGDRLVAFGEFAGRAGMTDTLDLLGKRLQEEAIPSPFKSIKQTIEYPGGTNQIKEGLKKVQKAIAHEGLPDTLPPMVFGFTGGSRRGRVAKGAMEIFRELNPTMLSPIELLQPGKLSSLSRKAVYGIEFDRVGENGRYVRKDGKPASEEDFKSDPEAYESTLPRYMDLLTGLVSCATWVSPQPRHLTRTDLAARQTNTLRVIGDISCDIWPQGPFESTQEGTKPENPYYVYDPTNGRYEMGWKGPGIAINAIESNPCELPLDATLAFGDMLFPFMPGIARANYGVALEDSGLPPEIQAAAIVWNGQFTPRFRAANRPDTHKMYDLYSRVFTEKGLKKEVVLNEAPVARQVMPEIFTNPDDEYVRFRLDFAKEATKKIADKAQRDLLLAMSRFGMDVND